MHRAMAAVDEWRKLAGAVLHVALDDHPEFPSQAESFCYVDTSLRSGVLRRGSAAPGWTSLLDPGRAPRHHASLRLPCSTQESMRSLPPRHSPTTDKLFARACLSRCPEEPIIYHVQRLGSQKEKKLSWSRSQGSRSFPTLNGLEVGAARKPNLGSSHPVTQGRGSFIRLRGAKCSINPSSCAKQRLFPVRTPPGLRGVKSKLPVRRDLAWSCGGRTVPQPKVLQYL